MSPSFKPDRLQNILGWLMPSAAAEALLGDLVEERRVRLQEASPASVARWYWMQLVSSIPVLLWTSARRGVSFFALVIALGGYVTSGVVASALRSVLSPATTSLVAHEVMALVCGIVALAAGGFAATWLRPAAGRLLAALVLVSTFLMMVFGSNSIPLWYHLLYVVLGSLAPVTGAAVYGRWRRVR